MLFRSLWDLIDRGESPIAAADIAAFRESGHWPGQTIRGMLSAAAQEYPKRTAVVGYRSDGPTRRWSYEQLDRAAGAVANALAALGVTPGDAVAVMLPNWLEYQALIFGINEVGAVYVGIPVSYGELQAQAILRRSKAKVLVIPRGWRSQDHLTLVRKLRADLPHLEHVVVVDEDSSGLQSGEVLWSSLANAAPHTIPAGEPTDICYLGFTSGTTGEPKGAMHTHETLLSSVHQLAKHVGQEVFGDPMVQLVASPVGHHTGYVWGTLFTVAVAGTGVHVDRWDPAWGVDVIRREAVTSFFGAPTFLQDLMRTSLAGDPNCPLRGVVLAGSSVPRNLPAQAAEAFGAYVAPAWGMTECSIIVSCSPDEPQEILQTDGSVFEGSKVRVQGTGGQAGSFREIQELQVTGPTLFLGYYDRPDATEEAFTADGWFRTGDTASIDERGWVSLLGRSKDIIIRGGENIPVTDIETVLFDHPAILNAAVVGVPDERLGERSCAVLVLKAGADLGLPEISEFLLSRGLSKHYLPERIVVTNELPMTQSGKIQKYKVRDLVMADANTSHKQHSSPRHRHSVRRAVPSAAARSACSGAA